MILNLAWCWIFFIWSASAAPVSTSYEPRGVGGGGAMAGYSIAPNSDLRFVGTDMGTLFRSEDRGKTWTPVSHAEVRYGSELPFATEVGFTGDPKVVFFADMGREPKRSRDGGITWSPIAMPLGENERIRYFTGDLKDPKRILCGTSEGLLQSTDQGDRWTRVESVRGAAQGTAFIESSGMKRVFHATDRDVYVSDGTDGKFLKWYTPEGTRIRGFAGGVDAHGLTLAFLDSKGEAACSWAKSAGDASAEQKQANLRECGHVWVARLKGLRDTEAPVFRRTSQAGGRFIRMAENDSRTIYVTGGDWVRQYGSKIWVSKDAGQAWSLALHVYDWDKRPYRPWPKEKLEYSAVGLDVGWDDNAPFGFAIHRLDSKEAGVVGHYFLHTTRDRGEHWHAPFTRFAGTGERTAGKNWMSTGLEVTSALRMKFHPKHPEIAYVSLADLGGYASEDGGRSFRITKAKYNTNYDYAFDPGKKDWVLAASGDRHDFPVNVRAPVHAQGGIFESNDRGRKWKRLTPDRPEWNRQFLSVAYDPQRKTIYGGTQGGGVARSTDGGKTWKWMNAGFPEGQRVIPQIDLDPRNGTAYALLTGEAPEFPHSGRTGIYRLDTESGQWELLREKVERPKEVEAKHALWNFPTAFAVDFSKSKRDILWLTDLEEKGAWLASGVWKSIDGGKTWRRVLQFTHPMSIVIDQKRPDTVIVSGLHDVSGKWGQGGSYATRDGGITWRKNEKLPLLANLFGYTPDPARPENGFYLFFGGGLLYGRSPSLDDVRQLSAR